MTSALMFITYLVTAQKGKRGKKEVIKVNKETWW